jgi:hypothetical protein
MAAEIAGAEFSLGATIVSGDFTYKPADQDELYRKWKNQKSRPRGPR